ncbi:MAG TPA: hypothetical protein EYG95_06660 [Campylobacterales bacterium]|nr:hypothetical protein [Campylobacterales bacterium]
MEMSVEEQVLLLGIYKRKEDESINSVVMMLEDTGMFTYKEGKKYLKSLKEDGYIEDDRLTVTGTQKAQEVEEGFKLQ